MQYFPPDLTHSNQNPKKHLQLWVPASVDLPILLAEVLINLILYHIGRAKGL